MSAPLRILHAHSTFDLGGKEARAVRLMNAWGQAAEHTVLTAMPGHLGARAAIDPGVAAAFPPDAPPLAGRFSLLRLKRLVAYARGFDLVLTYNWGAFDMVMARRLWARTVGCPPLVHHEDGFNTDEAERLSAKRNLYRRLGLPAAHRLVVPSRRLERIARTTWKQPPGRLQRIPNGIPVKRFGRAAAIPGLPQDGAPVIGTAARLGAVKNLPRLVRAFAHVPQPARLVIVGEGPERERIQAQAAQLGLTERVLLPGFMPDPATFMGAFDIFALSSDSEQFPISVVEAMASSLPVAAPDVGDIADMVAEENRQFVVADGDEAALASTLQTLAADPTLRARLGAANRRKAAAEYDEAKMIGAYARLYEEAAGRPGCLSGARS